MLLRFRGCKDTQRGPSGSVNRVAVSAKPQVYFFFPFAVWASHPSSTRSPLFFIFFIVLLACAFALFHAGTGLT